MEVESGFKDGEDEGDGDEDDDIDEDEENGLEEYEAGEPAGFIEGETGTVA